MSNFEKYLNETKKNSAKYQHVCPHCKGVTMTNDADEYIQTIENKCKNCGKLAKDK